MNIEDAYRFNLNPYDICIQLLNNNSQANFCISDYAYLRVVIMYTQKNCYSKQLIINDLKEKTMSINFINIFYFK